MKHNRWFNAVIGAALVAVAALTAWQAAATAAVVEAAGGPAVSSPAPADVAQSCPFSTAERQTLRAAYVAQGGGWVAQAGAQTATGLDGGLLATLDGRLARTSIRTAAGIDGGLLALRACGPHFRGRQ